MSRVKNIPIFGKQKVNFVPSFALTHLCVSNNRVVLAMQNKTLLKIDLSDPDNPEEIDLKAHAVEAKLSNMYLDPSGQHLILAFSPRDRDNPAEVMYLGPKLQSPTKLKEIPKLRSHIITAVAWNPSIELTNSNATNPFLLGTSKGLIFEAEISNAEVKVSKQLYDIGKGSAAVISGLEYFFIPRTTKCFVLVATSKKLYQFKGFIPNKDDRPWFLNIFNNYLSQTGLEEVVEFGEVAPYAVSDTAISRLNVLYDTGSGYPKNIGYLADANTFVFNDVVRASTSSTLDNFLKDIKTIRYPHIPDLESSVENTKGPAPPRTLVMTDYHVLMLYNDCVKGICMLSEEVIFEDKFEMPRGKVINIARDPVKGSIWLFTERAVQRYAVKQEDRNIWKIYLDKEDFPKAQESCKGDGEKMERISIRQAEYYFNKKEYEKSAMYYALTKASFEEIALKFVQIDDSAALKMFLLKKLSSLQPQEMTKVAVLVLWIIELYLNQLGTLRDFGKKDTPDYRNMEDEFLQFMGQNTVKECVKKNKKAVYDLMASHGDRENLIHFTLVMKDFDEVIENSISSGQYKSALTTLQTQKDRNLYTRFIPVLLDKDPTATIDCLILAGPIVSPIKLLPKFSSKLDTETAQEITRYLEHCTNSLRLTDQPIHDYLLSLYVQYYPVEKLMDYLVQQGTDIDRIRYDPKYALMMCLEKKLHIPTIHLYTLMGLYEEAVALAIQIDLELAKKTADVPENDEELRKKLWLRIAKHVVKEKNDIQQAMDFLQQCELLKIEDILPFFPNFVTIDHFKEAICSSLQDYNRHIQDLKDEMEEATKSAEVIREEIQAVRNRCAIVRANDRCTLCEIPLLIKNFYVFPCGHQFHAECLMGEVIPQLSHPRKALLSDFQKKLQNMTLRQDALSTGSAVISARDQIKSDIDDIVASECIYCGDSMIKLIDVPFITDDDYDRIQKEWE